MPYKNIEDRKANERKRYNKNREEILNKGKEKETCECGAILSHHHLLEHKKTNKHLQTLNNKPKNLLKKFNNYDF